MCLGAVGTQTGGSILRPASYCGIVGFKPTFGSVDRQGVYPVSPTLDHVGPLGRRVEDATLLWSVLAGVAPPKNRSPSDPKPKLLIPAGWPDACDPAVRASFADRAESLVRTGSEVREVEIGIPLAEILAAHRAIMAVEAAKEHAARFRAARERYAPGLASLLDEGAAVPESKYAAALALQSRVRDRLSELLLTADAFFLPATTSSAPPLVERSTGDPRMNSPFSLTGHPAISLPRRLPSGRFFGLQLVGSLGGDAELLAIARQKELLLTLSETEDKDEDES
jgi:aspartyl-tRNA(Asn)/glutamyl-tRNA(Gln) amidotransferase subunit A